MSQYGNQLKNYGIQLQNIASQIQNISMNLPMMGNEIQNMACQISNLGSQIFNIGMNFFDQLNLMNNMLNQPQYINNIHEPNFYKINKKRISIIFKNNEDGKVNGTLFVPLEMPVKDLLKLYLKRINRNPNDDEFLFIFNANAINNYKINIQEIGLKNNSIVQVIRKQNNMGGLNNYDLFIYYL